MVTQILNCPGNCALIVCNCQLVFLEAYLPWQRLLIFKIMQIIYSENRGFLSSENSLWWIQYLSFRNFNCWHLTSGYRETLLIALKIPVQTLKKYYLVLSKMFFFFLFEYATIYQCYHEYLDLRSLPPPPPFKIYFYSKCLCLCKCISHVYSEMLISYLRSGIQLYLNYMPDGWAMHTFQFFDNLMNISLGKMRLSEHPKSSVTVVS